MSGVASAPSNCGIEALSSRAPCPGWRIILARALDLAFLGVRMIGGVGGCGTSWGGGVCGGGGGLGG